MSSPASPASSYVDESSRDSVDIYASSKSSGSSSHQEALSWEVLDCSDSDSRPASETTSTPQSRPQTDTGDWILQPDTDRDGEATDICMPVIESITSLGEADSTEKSNNNASGENTKGQSRCDDHSFSEDDTDRLIIDTSTSATDVEMSLKVDSNTDKDHNAKGNGKASNDTQSFQYAEETSKETRSLTVQNGHSESQDTNDASTTVSDTPTKSQQEKDESSDSGLNLVISSIEGNVSDSQKISEIKSGIPLSSKTEISGTPLSSKTEKAPANSIKAKSKRRKAKESAVNGANKKPSTSSKATETVSTPKQKDSKKNMIIIDPESPDDIINQTEHIDFLPGIIKLEPEEKTKSHTKTLANHNITPTTSFSTSSNISTSASLSGGTALSTASRQTGIASVQSPANMNKAYQTFQQQQQLGPRTILRSPTSKPVSQVVVRHSGPRNRPSYIRLGSQTLQHFARLTSPQAGMQLNQQRMISVLNNAITPTSLPPNFSQLLQAGPPGTLVSTGGSAGNPLKVLILPPQASTAGQATQANVQFTTSTTQPVYSMTTTGTLGAISSVGNFSNSKSSSLPQGPSEVKSASQILTSSLTGKAKSKANQSGNPKNSGGQGTKSKSQSAHTKAGSNKTQSHEGSQLTKSLLAGDDAYVADLIKNIADTEDRLKRRMLSKTNLIKEYHPALTSGLGHVSFEFYSCHGCRDVFVNKSSLDHHRNRQSLCITYTCDPCGVTFNFSNKCQFRCHMLKHVQELKLIHKNLLERITITPMKYSASKSKSNRTESPNVESTDVPSSNTVEQTEGLGKASETKSATDKETDRLMETSEAGAESSSLGLTIASVSSVSIDDHQDNTPTKKNTQNKVASAESPLLQLPTLTSAISALPPLTSSSSASPVTMAASPLSSLMPTSATATTSAAKSSAQSQLTQVIDLTNADIPLANVHHIMGPLAQGMKTQPKSDSVTSKKVENTPTVTEADHPAPLQSSEGGNIFCTECSATFSSFMKLQRHFNDADKPHPLRPPCCNIRLTSQCCVRAHMRTHKNERPYVCSDCGECFRGELAVFRKHIYCCKRVMQSAVMVFPCPRCQVWFPKIDDLRGHVRKEHSESYLKCNLCPMAFKTVASFKEHALSKHPSESTDSVNYTSIYKCPLCDSVFHEQKMKMDHLEQHINNIYANQRVSFVCELCKKLCYNYAMMRYHLKEKHSVAALGNICDLCGVDAGPTIKHLVAHQKRQHKVFPANMLVDPVSKPDGNDTSSHSEENSSKDILGLLDTKGNKDNKSTEKKGSIVTQEGGQENQLKPDGVEGSYHGNLPRASSIYNQTEKDTKDDGNGDGDDVRCHICHQKFANRMALSRHKKLDHGLMKRKRIRENKSPVEETSKKVKQDDEDLLDETTPQLQVKSNYMLRFECDHCEYRTPTFQDLQQHQAEVHDVKARFPCLLCGMTYHTIARLEEHTKSTHEGQIREYPYLCWICVESGHRKGYMKRAHLVRHFMNFHKIASKSIDSDRLDEMDRKANLSTEEKLKTDNEENGGTNAKKPRVEGEERFSCIKCDFESTNRQEFQDHLGKHKKGGSDSYQCPECGMCFTVLPPLKNHLRLVHKIKNFNDYIERSGVKLKTSDADKARVAVTHKSPSAETSPDKNSLECTVCYRSYTDQVALKNHMRNHGMAFIRSRRLALGSMLTD